MLLYIPIEFSYLALGAALLIPWLVVFWFDKPRRKQLLIASTIAGIVGPFAELLYIPDYWQPVTLLSFPIGNSYLSLEDFLFAFAFFGVLSAIPGLMFPSYRRTHPISWLAVAYVTLSVVAMLLFSALLWRSGLNSIFATSFVMLVSGLGLLLADRRRALLLTGCIGALAMTALMFLIYLAGNTFVENFGEVTRTIWSLYGTSLGATFLGVPLTEMLWASSAGFFFSILFTKYQV